MKSDKYHPDGSRKIPDDIFKAPGPFAAIANDEFDFEDVWAAIVIDMLCASELQEAELENNIPFHVFY